MTSKIFLDETQIEKHRNEYLGDSCIFLPRFIEEKILQNLLKKLDESSFQTKLEKDGEEKFGKVMALLPGHKAVLILNMLLNDEALFNKLNLITDCGPIGSFIGRIHRSETGEDHEISWHGDNADNRLLGITLGLGTDNFTGAKLQLRKKDSKNIIREFGQINAGDAIIFRINPELQHRLTVLESGRRTVGVGWFRSGPGFNFSPLTI